MYNYFNNEEFFSSQIDFTDGCALKFTFPNGYTGSVVRRSTSDGGPQGLWEVAVMYDGRVVYDTPITNDVIGFLTADDVELVLEQIRELPERTDAA